MTNNLNDLAKDCFNTSFDHGFWDKKNPDDTSIQLEKLMLIVTEVAEAAEAVRHDNEENLEEELADIIIRVMDFAGAKGMDIDLAVLTKMARNEERSYMHDKLA